MNELLISTQQVAKLLEKFSQVKGRDGRGWDSGLLEMALDNDCYFGEILDILQGRASIVFHKILEDVKDTFLLLPIVERFDVSKYFDSGRRHSIGVNISSRDEWFCERFLNKSVEKFTGSKLSYGTLKYDYLFYKIVYQFGGEKKIETSLVELWRLLERQPNGEKGELLTNGRSNVFFGYDQCGMFGVIICVWEGYGWKIFSSLLEKPYYLDKGARIFFPISSKRKVSAEQ